MVGLKFFFLFITLCESQQSLLPQAISQLVQGQFGETRVKIEVIYNSDRIQILSETIKLLSETVSKLKVTNVAKKYQEFETEFNRESHLVYSNDAIFLFDTMQNYEIFSSKKIFWF